MDKTVLETAMEREVTNGTTLKGKELTDSNKVLAELCKVEVEANKAKAEAEIEKAKIEADMRKVEVEKARVEADERRAKRETRQRYVNTGFMGLLAVMALFADSDTFIGRANSRVMGYVSRIIFKG